MVVSSGYKVFPSNLCKFLSEQGLKGENNIEVTNIIFLSSREKEKGEGGKEGRKEEGGKGKERIVKNNVALYTYLPLYTTSALSYLCRAMKS